MVRLRIDLAYDGGPFAGFARQADQVTVQGTLEGALSRLSGLDLDTTCAGRTDRGVHALAQVVSVDIDTSTRRAARLVADLSATRERIDGLVGSAIAIWSVTTVDEGFDARFSAVERAYRYRIVDAVVADPRLHGLRWQVPARLDVEAMHAGVQHVVGEHDYASFCRKAAGKHTTRRTDEAAVVRADDEIHVTLRGKAFCHNQVRSIVGCLAEVGRGRRPPAWIGEVLCARDRSIAARVAPPYGLTLEAVRFADPYPPAPLVRL
ncbi:MAG: tRNA pseudouridine(38-40) synthase TruA [Actinobacteria bacterium]|nr:tRNA pseudouridine(38-40) synthase TruA [Actinomycetota bacterium]